MTKDFDEIVLEASVAIQEAKQAFEKWLEKQTDDVRRMTVSEQINLYADATKDIERGGRNGC